MRRPIIRVNRIERESTLFPNRDAYGIIAGIDMSPQMLLFEAFLAIPVIWLIYVLYRRQRVRTLVAALKPYESKIVSLTEAFDRLFVGGKYVRDLQFRTWNAEGVEYVGRLPSSIKSVATGDPFQRKLIRLLEYREKGRALIDEHNIKVTESESDVLKHILDGRKIPANNDQLIAAVSEEDNTLVVAGAGTGKTTTIMGKIAYLIDRLEVPAEDILVLSFATKVAEEMQNRVDKYFPGIDITVKTFHSFGLQVIATAIGGKPTLAFDNTNAKRKWAQKEFESLLKQNNAYLQAAVHYFAFYMRTEELEPQFKTLDEYYRYIKTERVLTLRKEQVKSQQEAMLANFLYMSNIKYEYERPYEIQTADVKHRQYRPDFYLPDYGIYIEHFGVNRQGKVRFVQDESKNAELSQTYVEEMQWKRGTHNRYRTQLVETFSYEFFEGNWQELLTKKLKERGINLVPRPASDVVEMLRDGEEMYQIIDLFLTFMDLAKANHYLATDIEQIVTRRNKSRELAFSTLFVPLYKKYEDYLSTSKLIDFHDMLNEATKLISAGKALSKFKYIIIDEFQDFSVSKNQMVQALCKQNPETRLFCVGDDWQAIFRFAGSDVALMSDFSKYHGFTNTRQLVITNRLDSKLAKITNEFILMNPSQIKKSIQASRELRENPLEIVRVTTADKDDRLVEILERINTETSTKSASKRTSVMVLGRYNFSEPENLPDIRRKFPELDIDFLTVHRSKGSEADYVIVLDVIKGKYGFPANIADDPILEIVLSGGELYPHAEERRLMYVALTRTRGKVYVFTQESMMSPFVIELDSSLRKADQLPMCGRCGGLAVQRTGKFGDFYGCGNYPMCRWTSRIPGK